MELLKLQLIAHLAQWGASSAIDIAEELGTDYKATWDTLQNLCLSGNLTREGKYRTTRYQVSNSFKIKPSQVTQMLSTIETLDTEIKTLEASLNTKKAEVADLRDSLKVIVNDLI